MPPKLVTVVVSFGVYWSTAVPVSAYDRLTHGSLTDSAFTASASLQDYLQAVELPPTGPLNPTAVTRPELLTTFVNDATPLGWLIEGSIREDDYDVDLDIVGCEPPQNPPSGTQRIRHHFYDPVLGEGMRFGPFTGVPAPDWAVGEEGRGPEAGQNQFSLLDARFYQLRSLVESVREERDRYAALLFRSLGQVVHVLQDMAQPQHTRNDVHPACTNQFSGYILPEHSWYEDYIERRIRGLTFRGRPPHPLPSLLYLPPTLTTARSYFTHFDDRSGLADFSARNFFTAMTNLPFCAGREDPPCRLDAYRIVSVPHAVTTIFGLRLEAPVRLLMHTAQDPITQAPIPDIAVSSWSVWNQHLERRGLVPMFSLNVLNYDSISDVLLPRAVGYSAGLLDHFFAGRLDASVQPAGGEDPTVLKVIARNESEDAVDGVLEIYAEDTADERRHRVLTPGGTPLALGPTQTGVVLAGGSFPEVTFRPPFATEKYVVVYHGRRLGPPRVEDPPQGEVGAVMARVLGGPRAEAIVPQADRRLLRTVTGTFALPESADGLTLLQWSDLDNQFLGVATTPLPNGSPAPEEIRLFRVERPAGSVTVPVVGGSDPPVVDATLVQALPFPYGLTLPATVDYVRRLRVRQPLVTYPRTITLQWQDGEPAGYRVVADAVGPATLEVPVDETVTFAERFPIVLDRGHLFGATSSAPRPYFWRVLEVGQDATERVLALVEVRLTQPEDSERAVALRSRNETCSALEPRGALDLTGTFRGEGILALIDVERGETLGITADPLYAPFSTELVPVTPLLQERLTATRIGGPLAGTETRCSDRLFLDEDPASGADVLGDITLPAVGVEEFGVPGLYRADVEAAASHPIGITTFTNESILVYAVVDDVPKAVRVTAPSFAVTGQLPVLREGMRMRPGPEVLLRFERPTSFREVHTTLVRWDPQSPARTQRALTGELDPGRYRLVGVTPEAAMLTVEDAFGEDPRTVLADLTASTLTVHPGDLSSDFVLLPPGALYNLADTHFYTRDTLTETALPLALAPGPASTLGAYHLIVQE